MESREFRVVTQRRWLADEFVAQGAIHDWGFDVDETAAGSYWWAPGHWVARAAASGVELPLLSCGQKWLTHPSLMKFRKRPVVVVEARNATHAFEALGLVHAHVKLPEVKTDAFPAAIRSLDEVRAALREGILRAEDLIQVSCRITLGDEARFFVAHGRVVAWSWYRAHGKWHDEEGFDAEGGVIRPLSVLADAIAALEHTPPGFVVDVAMTDAALSPTPVLLEANAAWSSNPYDADMDGVVEAVKAAHDFEGRYPQWRFNTAQYGSVPRLRSRGGGQ